MEETVVLFFTILIVMAVTFVIRLGVRVVVVEAAHPCIDCLRRTGNPYVGRSMASFEAL